MSQAKIKVVYNLDIQSIQEDDDDIEYCLVRARDKISNQEIEFTISKDHIEFLYSFLNDENFDFESEEKEE